jgi:hypothetical protein
VLYFYSIIDDETKIFWPWIKEGKKKSKIGHICDKTETGVRMISGKIFID